MVFLLKVGAGICLFAVYTFYYTDRSGADIYKYFDDSRIMFDALLYKPLDFLKMITGINNDNAYFDTNYYHHMNNWYRKYESNSFNDNHIIIRLNAVLRLFSFGYYQVHNVFINFISLIGLIALFKFLNQSVQGKKKELFIACFLIPSVVFWGSGVLKEGLLLFGMGILLYSFNNLILRQSFVKNIFLFLMALIILRNTKIYILAILIPLMIAFIWVKFANNKYVFYKYMIVLLIYFAGIYSVKFIFPEYDILQYIAARQSNFLNMSDAVKAGSRIPMVRLEPSMVSFILHSPKAFYNTLCLPWFFNSSSLLTLFNGIENLIFILTGILSICYLRVNPKNNNLFCFSLFYVVLMFTLIGLTTPVIGAIVRYKIPALPFLAVLLMLYFDGEKLTRHVRYLKQVLKFR